MATVTTTPPGTGTAGATDRATANLPVVLRVVAAFLWLSNVSWKVPPDFGKSGGSCGGLCGFVDAGVQHPVFPPFSWLLEHLVLPNLTVFGYLTLVIETGLGVLLLTGTLTRAAALVGVVQSAFIGLSVANAPGEWYWSYILMVMLHLAVFATAAGRRFGIDVWLRARPDRAAWVEALT